MPKLRCSGSLQDLDLVNLQHEINALEAAGIDEIHFDVADGDFVPGFALGTDLIKAVKGATKLPCSAHLLVRDPQRHLQQATGATSSSRTPASMLRSTATETTSPGQSSSTALWRMGVWQWQLALGAPSRPLTQHLQSSIALSRTVPVPAWPFDQVGYPRLPTRSSRTPLTTASPVG